MDILSEAATLLVFFQVEALLEGRGTSHFHTDLNIREV